SGLIDFGTATNEVHLEQTLPHQFETNAASRSLRTDHQTIHAASCIIATVPNSMAALLGTVDHSRSSVEAHARFHRHTCAHHLATRERCISSRGWSAATLSIGRVWE